MEDSRELIFDEVMVLIGNGLTELVDAAPSSMIESINKAAQNYTSTLMDFRTGLQNNSEIIAAAARLSGLVLATYAQVLRDAIPNESREELPN